jgi:hypothetical protein
MYPWVVILSLAKWLEKPLFYHSYTTFGVWPRALHDVTRIYCSSMSCFAMDSSAKGRACSANVSLIKGPSCTMWVRSFTKYVIKYDAISHSTEQDILPIVFLISKQVVSYQTRGDTCCPGVSTLKIRSLADLSTTCHGDINRLYHSNHSSNHSIDPHHSQLTSRQMEDHHTLTNTQANLNITKDGRFVWHSWLHG